MTNMINPWEIVRGVFIGWLRGADNMQRCTKALAVILCLILITGVVAVASASEATKLHEPAQEVTQGGHEVSAGVVENHEAAPEGGEEHEAPEDEHEIPPREYGAPAAYFFIGAIILLAVVIARREYGDRSDLSRKVPGLIAATIYIFSIMVIAHYIVGAWSLILVPVFLLALWRFWPQI